VNRLINKGFLLVRKDYYLLPNKLKVSLLFFNLENNPMPLENRLVLDRVRLDFCYSYF
jgi:hypothetical protein